jgi:hypothetical protein
MNLQELAIAVQFVKKQMPCPHCKKRYTSKDIHVVASAKYECLLEMHCSYCNKNAMTDLVATPKNHTGNEKPSLPLINQVIRNGITDNDILDVKNFLSNFDGDFKKIFMP